MDQLQALWDLGLALALGGLVGLQRERAEDPIGGIRTFPLIAAVGFLCAVLAPNYGLWMPGVGLLALTALLVLANVLRKGAGQEPGHGVGLTTEVAALIVYLIGVQMALGWRIPAAVEAGAVAVLLHMKAPLHDLVRRLGSQDVTAVMRFVLLSLVVLPLLPDVNVGPYGVLNPRGIWWMVVLIVGIGLAGYAAVRLLGSRAGVLLGGCLGGLVSSTATTATYAREVRGRPAAAVVAGVAVGLASAVACMRILVEVAAVAPAALVSVAVPMGIVAAVIVISALVQFFLPRSSDGVQQELRNPAELGSAFVFAGIYALVLVGVAWVRDHFGSNALYAVAVISGLTDVDAITLSTSKLMADDTLPIAEGWRLITVAALANLGFKGVLAVVLGGRSLLGRILLPFLGAIFVGILLVALLP